MTNGMILFSEYRVQTIFVILQMILIVGGMLLFLGILKATGHHESEVLPAFLSTIKTWGFFLIIVPVVWSLWTVKMEENPENGFSKRRTMASGILLIVVLSGIFLFAAMSAASTMRQDQLQQFRGDGAASLFQNAIPSFEGA